MRDEAGIYLWTIPLEGGHLVYYVGETGRSFCARLIEHYMAHAAGMYHLYSPKEFAHGEKVLVWPGRYDVADRKSVKDCILNYPRLSGTIWETTLMMRFFLAPLSCESRTRRRLEGAIANALRDTPGLVGDFQDRGIRYDMRKVQEEPVQCTITSEVPLLGMPERLTA